MYGATCVGIVLEDSAVADLALAIKDAGADEILTQGRDATSDNLGLQHNHLLDWRDLRGHTRGLRHLVKRASPFGG
jgi:hypothetical protein